MKEKNIKIIVGYIIDKAIYSSEEIKQYTENLLSYVNQVDHIYIYNRTQSDLEKFYEAINKYQFIDKANCPDYGEAEIYKELIVKANEEHADYVTILKPYHLYENESFLNLKKYLLEADTSRMAVLTPMPLFGSQLHERKAEEFRAIKGCRLYGALLNLKIYNQTRGIKEEYYQTTFDYDYCLLARSMGYDIMLAQNEVLRDQNYRVITRKFFFITLSAFDRDLMDVYYETRNRYYLWEEYKSIDPEYVKLDKKLAKKEKQEIRTRDKHYKDKFKMMEKAKEDYKNHILGKYTE